MFGAIIILSAQHYYAILMEMIEYYARMIAETALEIGAFKLRPEKPFVWASGYKMPVYNDNRMLIYNPEHRMMITNGFELLIEQESIEFDIIAGVLTGGVPHAVSLANALEKPFIYVRDKPKSHGMKNQIEGIDADKNLQNKKVLVIEDLISFGGSSAKAVQAVRNAKGECDWCLSIFSYDFPEAKKEFNKLEPPCNYKSILYYPTLLEMAVNKKCINEDQFNLLLKWRKNPMNWWNNLSEQ